MDQISLWSGERQPVYDTFEDEGFFIRPPPFKNTNDGKNVDMTNPRNLYKKLLMDSRKLLPIPVSLQPDEVKDVRTGFETVKNLFQKNWRLHSASWTDYEKKKVTGSTGSLKFDQIIILPCIRSKLLMRWLNMSRF
jgi:hypothetical protein